MTQGSQREKWLRNVLDNLQKSANLWEKFLVSTSLLSLPLSLLRSLKNLCFLILRFCFKLLVFLKTNQKKYGAEVIQLLQKYSEWTWSAEDNFPTDEPTQ